MLAPEKVDELPAKEFFVGNDIGRGQLLGGIEAGVGVEHAKSVTEGGGQVNANLPHAGGACWHL